MPAILHAQFLILVLGVLFLPAVLVYCDFPATLILEKRVGSGNQSLELSELRARDKLRHGRILQGGSIGVVDFPVQGSSDPYTIGLYFTRVKLGSPPKEYYVQIDTGSDILWVNCNSCTGCPTTSELGIELEFFDPSSSSSAAPVSCTDSICEAVAQSYDSSCSANSQCSYSFQYGDGSGTSGYYVSDMFSFDTVNGDTSTTNSSANIVFGCSNYQSGGLTKPDRAVDGILGFGQHGMSVISQLASRGITPKVFSHCLKGEDKGGGILVLGEIVEPGIVYSPLVPSQPHYNLNLLSISVNGQTVSIDPEVFATSTNRGTIVDSGTTLAYLAEEAYDPFVIALAAAVPPSVSTFSYKGNKCFLVSSRDVFPVVSLNFAGAASMVLKPEEYLIQQLDAGPGAWCIGFLKTPGQGVTILGDLVLKDKIIVYDLARQRLGWADYDCSSSVNVSLASSGPGKDDYINAGQLSVSSSSRDALYQLIPVATGAFILYISSMAAAGFLYL